MLVERTTYDRWGTKLSISTKTCKLIDNDLGLPFDKDESRVLHLSLLATEQVVRV